MKTLVSCTPREFLTQTAKIRRAVSKWLDITDVMNIRKHKPIINDGMSDDEKRAAYEAQARENIGDMYDAIAEKHPDETVDLLAMLCFVEPEHVNDHPMEEYLNAVNEMLGSEAVLGFFTSLMRLGQTGILKR